MTYWQIYLIISSNDWIITSITMMIMHSYSSYLYVLNTPAEERTVSFITTFPLYYTIIFLIWCFEAYYIEYHRKLNFCITQQLNEVCQINLLIHIAKEESDGYLRFLSLMPIDI